MIDKNILAWMIPGSVDIELKHGDHDQSTHGHGGGGKSQRVYEKNVSGRNQKMEDVSAGDAITYLGKDYDVIAVKKIGGKQNRHDIIVKPYGKPEVIMVEGAGLNKGKQVPLYQKKSLTFYNTGGGYSADNFEFKD